MRLGIMQPYVFPYLGYFELIAKTDVWVVYDTAQDIKHGWVHRNRILHPTCGWQYITVPRRKRPLETPISDVEIAGDDWKARLRGQLNHYRKRAPNYHQVMELVDTCLAIETVSLSKFNVNALTETCKYLGIRFDPLFASDLCIVHQNDADACGKVLDFCQHLGATQYLNPAGAAALYDEARFIAANIELQIQHYDPIKYDCGEFEFEPALSIIDTLMWVGVDDLRSNLQVADAANAC